MSEHRSHKQKLPSVKVRRLPMHHPLAAPLLADEAEAYLSAQEARMEYLSGQLVRRAERYLSRFADHDSVEYKTEVYNRQVREGHRPAPDARWDSKGEQWVDPK